MTLSRLLCPFRAVLIFSPSAIPQNQNKGKGNNLIRPLADLEKDLKGKLERIKVHGKSLEGNLEGDSADRDVFVYLPPSYQSDPNRRYPVVYTLHGYGCTPSSGSASRTSPLLKKTWPQARPKR
jgi:hypothetical protein